MVAGGLGKMIGRATVSAEQCDPRVGRWTDLPSSPVARMNAAHAWDEATDRLYRFGGEGSAGSTGSTWDFYDARAGRWGPPGLASRDASMRKVRVGSSAVIDPVARLAYVSGGVASRLGVMRKQRQSVTVVSLDEGHSYDQQLPVMADKRANHALFLA
jgi:hypothetical protein